LKALKRWVSGEVGDGRDLKPIEQAVMSGQTLDRLEDATLQ
jgi:hypothetical protein